MASSLRAHKPANACCACYQHSVQLKLLNVARPTAAHHTLQQTAISATSRSTNTYIAAQTFKQKRIGVRQQHIAPFGGRPVTLQRAFGESNGSSKDPSLQDYVEVKIESVKVAQGAQHLWALSSVVLDAACNTYTVSTRTACSFVCSSRRQHLVHWRLCLPALRRVSVSTARRADECGVFESDWR